MEGTNETTDPLTNPYAPPLAPPLSPARRRTSSKKLVWVYVALQCAGIAADVAQVAGWIATPLGVIPKVAAVCAMLTWLYRTWQRLPKRLQVIDGHELSAKGLVLRHFIPIYGFYWMFRAQRFLCGAVDAKLIEKERVGGAPYGMAKLACTLQLVSGYRALSLPPVVLCVAVLCGVAWPVYMLAIEDCFARAFTKRGVG